MGIGETTGIQESNKKCESCNLWKKPYRFPKKGNICSFCKKTKKPTMKKQVQVICPYCDSPAEWVENKEIYGKNYGKSYMMWLCRPCDAYVGCHQNTKKPLGTLANKELREWRKKAHKAFDPFWKEWGMKRQDAYQMLETKFGKKIHIGEADIETCKKIIALAQSGKDKVKEK